METLMIDYCSTRSTQATTGSSVKRLQYRIHGRRSPKSSDVSHTRFNLQQSIRNQMHNRIQDTLCVCDRMNDSAHEKAHSGVLLLKS